LDENHFQVEPAVVCPNRDGVRVGAFVLLGDNAFDNFTDTRAKGILGQGRGMRNKG
jgi:hypothetical protein